jgi:hypothetical protein
MRHTVVLQIGADARQVDDAVDAQACDEGFRADSRELEDLWRANGAAAAQKVSISNQIDSGRRTK